MTQNNYQGRLQVPVHSNFDKTSTAAELIKGIDLTNKIAIVTGGHTGIGLETTRVLAIAGATVIVPARDLIKAWKNLEGIPNVEIESMDLADPKSVDAFADRFIGSGRPLHFLINNAGIMWVPLRRDQRGFESQLVTNYLSQFQLVARLWPALKIANGARIVNVSSQGHQFAPFNFEDSNFTGRSFETLAAYGQSKTAVNLFSLELDNRAAEFNVRAFSLHPGSIHGTELGREAPLELFQQMGFCDAAGNMYPEIIAGLKTVPQGAATTIWCATSPLLNEIGGVYCEDNDVAVLRQEDHESNPGPGVAPYSLDKANAKRLWKLSEEMTGILFPVV